MIPDNSEVGKNMKIPFNDKTYTKNRDDGSTVEYQFKNCIFEIADDNGTVEKRDLKHSIEANTLSDDEYNAWDKILTFFHTNNGQKWTKTLKAEITKMVSDFSERISGKKIINETVKNKAGQTTYEQYTDVQGNKLKMTARYYDYENNTEDSIIKTMNAETNEQISSSKTHKDTKTNITTSLFDHDNDGIYETKVVNIPNKEDKEYTYEYKDKDKNGVYEEAKRRKESYKDDVEVQFDNETGKNIKRAIIGNYSIDVFDSGKVQILVAGGVDDMDEAKSYFEDVLEKFETEELPFEFPQAKEVYVGKYKVR